MMVCWKELQLAPPQYRIVLRMYHERCFKTLNLGLQRYNGATARPRRRESCCVTGQKIEFSGTWYQEIKEEIILITCEEKKGFWERLTPQPTFSNHLISEYSKATSTTTNKTDQFYFTIAVIDDYTDRWSCNPVNAGSCISDYHVDPDDPPPNDPPW